MRVCGRSVALSISIGCLIALAGQATAAQFPGKGGGKNFGGQIANKGRNFRHQGR